VGHLGADACEPYCVDIEIVYTPPCTGVKAERILLEEYRWESPQPRPQGGHDVDRRASARALLSTNTRENQTGLLP
jgi:hypothetical protein